jgi:DNA-binding MarR family transcriptional regulator
LQTTLHAMSDSVFNLEKFVPYRLSVLTNTVSQGISHNYLDRHGIGITQWRVIAVLGPRPGLTASEIIKRTAMEKVPVSRAVKALIEEDLVDAIPDPGDRRCRHLQLTRKGREVFDDIIPRALAYEEALLQALSTEEAVQLTHVLDLLQKRANCLNDS